MDEIKDGDFSGAALSAGDVVFRPIRGAKGALKQSGVSKPKRKQIFSKHSTRRVSASVSYGQEVIARLLPGFHAKYPDVRIELLLSDRRVDLVRNKVDVAFRHGRLADSSHKASKLTDVTYSVVATPGYLTRCGTPAHPNDLSNHALLSFALEDFRHAWMFEETGGTTTEVSIKPILTVSGALALRQCVLGGMAGIKAETASTTPLSTKRLSEVSGEGTPLEGLIQVPGLNRVEGGEPIKLPNGYSIGGVGVSGASPAQDGECARAAVAKIVDSHIR